MKYTVHNAEGILRVLGLALLMISWAAARPATYDEYLALKDDIASVGSLRREVRQPLPVDYASEVRDLLVSGNKPKRSLGKKKPIKNTSGKTHEGGFFKTYDSDADGTKGFVKESFGKGDHGYKTLDTFHKEDGDNYGFENHTSFGHGKKGKKGGHHGKKGSHKARDHEGSGTITESLYADEGDGGYSEGGDGDEYYSEGGGGSFEGGSGESNSGKYGNSEAYSEHYSSGEGEGESEGGYSEGEGDGEGKGEGGYYEGDY